ncbi:MAG: C-GCAxxG-C-C family protein [Candidatus Bathyarchaeia archaeon]
MVESSKEEAMKRAYELGFNFERSHGSCSQCVFAAASKVMKIGDAKIFKAIDPIAGGFSRSGDGTCGALSGGAAAIGCKYGREEFSNPGDREKCMRLTMKLHDRFMEEYGSVICKDVQKKIMGRSFNLWDPKDYEEFEKAGGHTDKCPDVVGKVAKWTVEILWDEISE